MSNVMMGCAAGAFSNRDILGDVFLVDEKTVSREASAGPRAGVLRRIESPTLVVVSVVDMALLPNGDGTVRPVTPDQLAEMYPPPEFSDDDESGEP